VKYAKIEWERRFLLEFFPAHANVLRVRHITDHYIDGTSLRLREQTDGGTEFLYKLTQKLPDRARDGQQGLITTIYLQQDEFHVLSQLPSSVLTKTRYSVPPFGIDVFHEALQGLVVAEAEFSSAVEARSLELPSFVAREVTDDDRFTGGRLVHASRRELCDWLAEYGIGFDM
jgi:CYTH domain-containing protein